MLIKFDSDLFHQEVNTKDISFLIAIFSDNYRYDFIAELSEINNSSLFNQLSPIDQKLLEEYFNRYVTQPKKEINFRVSLKNESDKDLNFEESKIFFNQQYLLILENNLNDGYFVDTIINCFKSKARKISRHKNKDWLVYYNGGGCTNIENTIEANKKRYQHLPKDNHKYLRCFVLIDSDKKFPTQGNSAERQKLFDYLDENEIKYHQLYKREAENYLPFEILEKIEQNEDFIKVYKRLNDDVKDFIDLENGFPDKNRDTLTPELSNLYKNVSDDDYNFLRKNSLKINNFKAELPKLFIKANKEALKDRIKHQVDSNEFETLLEKITNEL
ncbi:hypothetical protein [Lacinutrix salivirga]